MSEATSIKQLIQQFAGEGMPDIVQAVVVQMDPFLKMVLVKDPNISLTEKSLIVPPARKWRMNIGVEYHLLCFNRGHVYYVLDRVKEYEKNG